MFDIDTKIIKKNLWFHTTFFIIGLFMGTFIYLIREAEIVLLAVALPLCSIIVGLNGMSKTIRRIQQVNKLNYVGKLYKNIPYHLEKTEMSVNYEPVMKPVINFKMPNGEIKRLEGDARHDYT